MPARTVERSSLDGRIGRYRCGVATRRPARTTRPASRRGRGGRPADPIRWVEERRPPHLRPPRAWGWPRQGSRPQSPSVGTRGDLRLTVRIDLEYEPADSGGVVNRPRSVLLGDELEPERAEELPQPLWAVRAEYEQAETRRGRPRLTDCVRCRFRVGSKCGHRESFTVLRVARSSPAKSFFILAGNRPRTANLPLIARCPRGSQGTSSAASRV